MKYGLLNPIAVSRETKHLQTMHVKALAQCRDFGAVLLDEAVHGVLKSGLCSCLLGYGPICANSGRALPCGGARGDSSALLIQFDLATMRWPTSNEGSSLIPLLIVPMVLLTKHRLQNQ